MFAVQSKTKNGKIKKDGVFEDSRAIEAKAFAHNIILNNKGISHTRVVTSRGLRLAEYKRNWKGKIVEVTKHSTVGY